ncbi:MAG: bifunctional [glutamate--ammonia ligase]-adenylyl-L-tyrosine phosphorylase/[glutamate--ammonia-ligase] adenylyltransferase [Burkholderiaceae bacterium]|nr:bifunctional [glutamate--ammonia ligase]-adenylyl-L-tyrosine phosphorylase/[glutamate--ammonia-ligase] adenylyltransferase [Burkholderiaceae bacterium]
MSVSNLLSPALQWSGALRRKLHSNTALEHWLIQAAAVPVTRKLVNEWYAELCQGHSSLPVSDVRRTLRQLREHVFFTLMVRDILGVAPLMEVVTAMSTLADLAVAEAYKSVATELAEIHGIPYDPETGLPQEMLILGMGKLGGRELNVSSDIDLIMLYGAEGETNGRRKISHHEFYGKVARHMVPVLSEMDADGYVFRTDLRLRPDGNSGPLAWSLDALEHYLVTQGREWERYAWIKARVIPCKAFADSQPAHQIHQLEALRAPFVYRKYFDFDALSALRSLRARIRQDWERRALARTGVDTVHNIKLGDGGIREIEFVVQLNQLIRAGRMPSLQQRALHAALYKQKKAGVLPENVAVPLEAAYYFLRRVEHLLQYREDEQTHLLPRDPQLRADLAAAMGMEQQAFETQLAAHRALVTLTFRDAFRIAGVGGDEDHAAADIPESAATVDLSEQIAQQLGEQAATVSRHVETLLDSHRMRSLPATSRKRLKALLPAIINTAVATEQPVTTATRLLTLVEHIAQRSAYLALLAEYPETLARVARIVAASPWAAQYLNQYPLLLDSLIEWRSLMQAPDFSSIADQLHSDLDACLLPDGQPDIEQQMNLMRDTQHQITFQLLAQDLEGQLTVEALADQLSALADMLLQATIVRVWPLVQPRNKGVPKPVTQAPGLADTLMVEELVPPRFAIIAYGKLGGKEIGYASDLDLVFVYDDEREDAGELYAKLGRRVTSWLSTMTSSGRLYEVDLRLRPDGDAGLLAASLDAFTDYQLRQAWPWEHQALTRARFVAGHPDIALRFDALREQILLLPRDTEKLKQDVRSMREKITAGHPNRSPDFDLKHDRGGMVDVEFVTQYLVLSHARQHPVLLGNLGNIALLQLAAQEGLLTPTLAAQAADAYRSLRKRQHALRLQGAERARVSGQELVQERDAVRRLWEEVIG